MISRMPSLFGSIACKVGLILVAMACTTFAAIGVGSNMSSRLVAEIEQLLGRQVPQIVVGKDAIDQVNELSDSLLGVLMANSRQSLADALASLKDERDDVGQVVVGFDFETRASIEESLGDFDLAVDRMHRALERRIETEMRMRTMVDGVTDLGEEAQAVLVETADTALFALTIGGEEAVGTVRGTLDTLVGRDFAMTRHVLEVRAEVNLLTGLVLALADERDAAVASIARDLATSSLRDFERGLERLAGAEALQPYLEPLMRLRDYLASLNDGGLIVRTAARDRILTLRQEAEAALSSAIDEVTFSMSVQSEDTAQRNESAIRALVEDEVGRLREAADIDTAVRNVLDAALLGASAPDRSAASGVQARADGATARLAELLESGPVDGRLEGIAQRLSAIVDREDGIVAARVAVLAAQQEALESSRNAGALLTNIVALTRAAMTDAVEATATSGGELLASAKTSQTRMWGLAVVCVLITVAAAFGTWLLLVQPIRTVTGATERLAAGNLRPIEGFEHAGGEIGRLGRTLSVFRDRLVEREQMQADEIRRQKEQADQERIEQEAKRQRELAAAEERKRTEAEARARDLAEAQQRDEIRRKAEAEREQRNAEQSLVVDNLARALDGLSRGDLTVRIETEFPGSYDGLRRNFNAAVSGLSQLIEAISVSADRVRGSSAELSGVAAEVAKRTEETAITLERTARSIVDLEQAAMGAAQSAEEVDSIMSEARSSAASSNEVVKSAVATMTEIETSSQAISKIVDLIEDIAFQTNLLALNAAVEAARAGDEGRGFAVVAMEVRSLAQRSSTAAREINDLIQSTQEQIRKGVSQVGHAGTALEAILVRVSATSERIAGISHASAEQSGRISEISRAVGLLDQATQRNAAMFEESAAATQMLNEEANSLTGLSGRFVTSGDAGEKAVFVSSRSRAA